MVAIDAQGKIACGCTTNGLTYKIPGWVWSLRYSDCIIVVIGG